MIERIGIDEEKAKIYREFYAKFAGKEVGSLELAHFLVEEIAKVRVWLRDLSDVVIKNHSTIENDEYENQRDDETTPETHPEGSDHPSSNDVGIQPG